MKKTILLLSVICMGGLVMAQDSTETTPAPTPTEMEPNQPYYYDITSMQATALEKQTATRKTQLKMFGLGGASSSYIIPGGQSAVAIPSADGMSFAISGNKLALSVLGSTATFSLHKLKVEGEERHAVIKEKRGLGGSDSNKGEKIEYTAKKEGDKTILTLSQKPAPGEYAFLNMRSLVLDKTIEVFCFRVE